jgi:broad specificity phosphatase PhoE
VRHLILVRHAQPEIVLGVPAHAWHLSEQGRSVCLPLVNRLASYKPSILASSPEPTAIETAEILASRLSLPVIPIPGLHEHEHEHERGPVGALDQSAFEAAIAVFFARPQELVLGEETAAQARDRFTRTIDGVVRKHPDGDDVAIAVAHGSVMTLSVAARIGVAPFPFWRRLRLPDVVALPLEPAPNPSPL